MSTKQLNFHIAGMHCASCASNIQRTLSKTKGVAKASVNYGNEQANLELDGADFKQVAQVVKKMGYTAILAEDDQADVAEELREKEIANLKFTLTWSAILSLVLLVISMLPVPDVFKNPYLMLLLSTPVQFVAGRRFYQGALSALRNKSSNMDTLVALGTSVAYFYSLAVILLPNFFKANNLEAHLYFETAAVIITFILLGKYLELNAKKNSSSAIKKLLGLQSKTATLWKNGSWQEVGISEVQAGDRLLVKPGEKVPVDSVIAKGSASLDESMLTGESVAVLKKTGDKVYAATINYDGSLEIIAKKVGQQTMLAQIIRLVKNAQGSKPDVQKLVDRISQIFVPVILLLATVTFIAWLFFDRNIALISLINILIIACPCALGLATPISLVVSVGKGAGKGILIKDAQALEISNQIKAIIFDKTGTLTIGQPEVQEFKIYGHKQANFVWNLVKTAETLSAHPLAKALVNYASKNVKQEPPITLQNFVSHAGAGIEAKYKKETLLIGTEALLTQNKIKLDQEMQELAKKWRQQAYSLVFVALGKQVLSIIAIADQERSNSLSTIQRLQSMGIKTIMLTGDNKQSAQNIAKKLQIDEVIAEVLPAQKEAVIKEMKAKYGVVAMVGDGINDAPALSSADVGIAMGNGTDVAIEAAGVTLLHSNIALVPQAIHLSQLTFQNIRQNLFWAFAYNIVLIPVAMGVFYPQFNLLLNPMLAGLAMAFSSVTVVANALRLKGQKL